MIEELRNSLNQKFTETTIAGQGLAYELRTPLATKNKVNNFEQIMFAIRREVFAIYYCEFVLKDPQQVNAHLAIFKHLMNNARANFINLTLPPDFDKNKY